MKSSGSELSRRSGSEPVKRSGSARAIKSSPAWLCILFVAIGLWCMTLAVPLAGLLARTEALNWAFVWPIVRITVLQAMASAALSTAGGILLFFALAPARIQRFHIPRWAELALSLPFGIPGSVAAFAWIAVFGRQGWLGFFGIETDILYSFQAVVLAHVFFNAPWIALWMARAAALVPLSQMESAVAMGAGRWRVFSSVIWPYCRWALASTTLQAYCWCAMSFAVVLILGGGPPVQTLETAIYSRMRFGLSGLDEAVALAGAQLLVTLLPWFGLQWVESRAQEFRRNARALSVEIHVAASGSFRKRSLWVLLPLLPFFAVFVDSDIWHPSAWIWSRSDFYSALGVSVALASGATLSTFFFAALWLAAWVGLRSHGWLQSFWNLLVLAPGGMSAIVLGVGYLVTYPEVRGGGVFAVLALLMIQAIILGPLVFRLTRETLRFFQVSHWEAARSLGASRLQAFFAVEWPRWRPVLISCLVLTWVASIGEMAAVSLLYEGDIPPLPVWISRLLGQYRFAEAHAASAGMLLLGGLAWLAQSKRQEVS